MAASTLQIGSGSYELLDLLESPGGPRLTSPLSSGLPKDASTSSSGTYITKEAEVSGRGNITNIRDGVGDGTISNLGIDVSAGVPFNNNLTNILANVDEFTSIAGGGKDTLNIFGNASGVKIFTDEGVTSPSLVNSANPIENADLLKISGNLSASVDDNRSIVYTDDGNDTIRICIGG